MATRRTKIVATVGPAQDSPGALERLIDAGVDVLRINLSHASPREQAARVRRARAHRPDVAVLVDLAGPKLRLGDLPHEVAVTDGQTVTLGAGGIPVGDPTLFARVHPGDPIFIADGTIALETTAVAADCVTCRVRVGGTLRSRKGINLPMDASSLPVVTEKDRADLADLDIISPDFVAVSYVRHEKDLADVRLLTDLPLVAKIEKQQALERLDAILAAADAVMVARGDLGVEMGYAELTGLQKTIIRQSLARNRVVITATQMMESMIQNPMPTRAEVSDVANAVLDGTDAVMLSAETAAGKYPVKAVQAMADVIRGAEKYQLGAPQGLIRVEDEFSNTEEAISRAVMYTASHLRVRAIVALTESGLTPLWMSRIRADIPIYAFTRHPVTRRRVTLYRGVYAVPFDITHTDPQQLYHAIFEQLLTLGLVEVNDLVILTKGDLTGIVGGTNSMQIVRVTQR